MERELCTEWINPKMYCKVGKARHLLDEHSLKSGKWVWNLDSFAHKFRKENTKYFIEREREICRSHGHKGRDGEGFLLGSSPTPSTIALSRQKVLGRVEGFKSSSVGFDCLPFLFSLSLSGWGCG